MKQRKPLRLADHDYSLPGLYSVTICVADKRCRLGTIRNGEHVCSPDGKIVDDAWNSLPGRFPTVTLDAYVVMPNHLHGIIALHDFDDDELPETPPQSWKVRERPALGDVIKAFKAATTVSSNAASGTPGQKLWQSRFYDHIVRSERELERFRHYIAENPNKWAEDPENPTKRTAW